MLDLSGEGEEEPEAAEALGSNREMHVNSFKRIRVNSSEKVMCPTGQLKCLYTNACSMGNKEEELVATAQMESYDLITIIETW